ncbi:sugar-transfer associated ATP-grasp domain-containing protein [Alloyangia pacifica]|uniref:sugar-transfer associated ATP-grasp domain-containing protein n=1 Tax=Alloyangia pacifica TaxID=311180 RepID=UPI001CFC92A2|nr:sugar-transfer associated ATP-grasp domain-containing protein [Alloyangia pacifica]
MSTATPATRALLAAPPVPKSPASQLIIDVARKHKVSPLRQLREMVSLSFGRGKLDLYEYYTSGCFSPDLSPAQKREFVGSRGSAQLNNSLSPIAATPSREFIRDKVLYPALLAQVGLRTTRTQAVAFGNRAYGRIPMLTTVEEIREFLLEVADYPIFGKPTAGSANVGSTFIKTIDRDTAQLSLANGSVISIDELIDEIVANFSTGFTFQSAVIQHSQLQEIIGTPVGTVRVVTLRDDKGIAPLNAVWQIPSPKAMSDNCWQAGAMLAEIDLATGRLKTCRRGTGLEAEWLEAHPVSGVNLPGFQMPFWEELLALACEGHALFPEFGVFGWDIAVAQDGPLIIECNANNPGHTLYQKATGRGILNEDFKPRFEAAADYSARSAKRG